MWVYLGEKFFKCEFCNVCCIMKGNFKLYICIKYSGNNFKCFYCDFLGDSKVIFWKYSCVYQLEYFEKCLECSYFCFSKVVLCIYECIYCIDCFFKCNYCSFDIKQFSNLSKYMKKFYGDMVKIEVLERKDIGRQSSWQVVKLDVKKSFYCDICDVFFMWEDLFVVIRDSTVSIMRVRIWM